MKISEIAQLAKVSPATISRYLNGGYVSEKKKEQIKAVIESTGYVPSASAQALRGNKYHLIGVIVPKLSSESVAKMIDGISEAIADTKYNIILANTSNSIEKELEFLKIFQTGMVDGVILIGTIITKKHHEIMLSYNDKPIVVLSQMDSKYSCVYFDDYKASFDATKHLIDCGCKDVAIIHVTEKDKAAGKSRIDGWRDAHTARGRVANEELMSLSGFTADTGYKAAQNLIKSNQKFDGLFCATDTIAFGAKTCLAENNISIPQDVKVASIGDSKMSAVTRPALTTVHMHYKTGGQEACRIMLEQLETKTNMTKQHKMSCELIVRESTEQATPH